MYLLRWLVGCPYYPKRLSCPSYSFQAFMSSDRRPIPEAMLESLKSDIEEKKEQLHKSGLPSTHRRL